MPRTESPHLVVIVGGGFGGLHAARALRKTPAQVTLIDRQNYHLFQPLLYQVATGGLSPANIAAPLRSILRRQKNVRVLQAEVVDFDLEHQTVVLIDGAIPFDSLIVAAGATLGYFGHDEWQSMAPGLKSIEDATEIRARVLSAFEQAERTDDLTERQRLLTFVIVGAGPTGVELAGALSELSRHTLKHDFRHIDPKEARILLVDAAPRVLSVYPEKLSEKATMYLRRLGVSVHTGEMVLQMAPQSVVLKHKDHVETIEAETILWAAGVQASPLAGALAAAAGVETDRAGRIPILPDLTLSGHKSVYVIGDMASLTGDDGKPLPGVAPVAIQQGKHAARSITERLQGKTPATFHYRDYGSMATIGRSAAVVDMGRFRFAGFFAWLLWLFIHLMQLVSFGNRVLVFWQWTWSYLTHGRAARLITGRRQGDSPPSVADRRHSIL